MAEAEFLASLENDVTTFLRNAYRTSEHIDVEFRIRTTSTESVFVSCYAHRLVLALWSPYFADMLYRSDQSKETIIFIDDVKPDAFKNMLEYMYGCSYRPKSVKEAHEQYIVAVRFKVASLVELLRNIINRTTLDASNVFDLIEASDYVNSKNLKRRCMAFICKRTAEIFSWFCDSSDTDYISPSGLHCILDSPKLSLHSEYELLQFVYVWGRSKLCKDAPQHSSTTRDVLEEFLPKLNFTALSYEDLAELYLNFPGFLKESEALSIFLNIARAGSYPMPDWHTHRAQSRVYTGTKSNVSTNKFLVSK